MHRNIITPKPLAIDLFSGLAGWSAGLLAEGYRAVGFDIENMFKVLGQPLPGGDYQLVLQDVMTLHGSQFRDAALIVASPPCQEYSYMAMPWSLAKQKRREYLDGTRDVKDLTALFDACFRIQREAIEAAGHFIPMVVENVRGACEWVGRPSGKFGSFYLWGDLPVFMPTPKAATKTVGHANKRDGHSHTRHLTNQAESDGIKGFADFHDSPIAALGSASKARKAASAAIAKIPEPLSRHIARYWSPNALGG